MATHARSIEHVRPQDGEAALVNRRAALGGLAAAGALLAVPHVAKAASPDAELFALARKAKALYAALGAAEDRLVEAEQRLGRTVFPEALIVTASDRKLFPRIQAGAGEPFFEKDIQAIRIARKVTLDVCRFINTPDIGSDWDCPQLVARAVEIERADEKHRAEREAARTAYGVTEAEAEVDRISAELAQTWRDLAFAPARTIEGVLAKLDAASAQLADARLTPHDFPKGCAPEDVAWMAAADLAALRLTEA